MTLAGAAMIVLGIVPFYVDFAAHVSIDFIQDHYEVFGICALAGVLVAFVGCIGWGKSGGRQRRLRLAAVVFIAPLLGLLIGYPISGTNAHGPAASMIVLFPVSLLLAVILLIMAALSHANSR